VQHPAGTESFPPPRPASSASPEPLPAHTRSRWGHWLSTAAALGAVIAGAALIPPGAAATTTTATSTAPRAAAVPAGPPIDPRAARYPLDCGPYAVEVVHSVAADLDGDGRTDAAVVVRCDAAGGTPPSGVYVLGQPQTPGGRPRITAMLVDPGQKMSVKDFAVTRGTISATLLGFSSLNVPRCCPDLQRKVKWRWRGGKFVLTPLPVAGSV
jgi:hypothetical protein